MKIMFYDFEASGLPLFDKPSDDPRQPHIVQAAAKLVDVGTRKCIASIDLIARANGWTFDPKAQEAHGISVEYSREVGVSEKCVVDALYDLWSASHFRVAHNETFDARIMRIGLKRYYDDDGEAPTCWKAGEAECTQRLSTPILKLPPTDRMLAAGRKHHKPASLAEAHQFFLGTGFEDAHSAMADVNACEAVYWAIQDRKDEIEAQVSAKAELAEESAAAPAAPASDDLPWE